ncbi:hypothetical protein ACLOJK_015811 [Asimina triloba]
MAATASSPSPLILPNLQKSTFLGSPIPCHLSLRTPQKPYPSLLKPSAKFNLFEIMGGRGLCGGEEGVEKELKKTIETPSSNSPAEQGKDGPDSSGGLPPFAAGEAAFEKELSGLTGGFPGGEKGLQKFIEENPPPTKAGETGLALLSSKPRPPVLPLLLPGMIVIVKNPKNAYHMYCGIIQRITDGKAGVLFEGGNWDRLITFRLDELERREKGPPMVNPKSCILEPLLENKA